MKTAYLDTSVLAAILFGEAGSLRWAREIGARPQLVASNLLEAELRAAVRREKRSEEPSEFLRMISWLCPRRPLSAEIRRVLEVAPLRGADLWHLAHALYAAPEPSEMAFLTLDAEQERARKALGFVSWKDRA